MRMNSTQVKIVLTAVGVLGVAGIVAAQSLMASGTIESVDPQQQRIALRTWLFFTKDFEVRPNARITDGQQPLQLRQLQPGDEASVEYVQQDGKRVAQAITIKKKEEGSAELMAPQGAEPSPPRASPPAQSSPSSQMPAPSQSWQPSKAPAPSSAEPSMRPDAPAATPSSEAEPVGSPEAHEGAHEGY
ncbi:MAG: hypothetical protein HYZ73_06535 [Elusimicrobia bacterium]|nr:hypothetical protein [Elusimicrobiota bacterium]